VLRRLDGVLQGDYRTVLRGHGLDLADIREYVPGDDVRYIDWNVTARMDRPYIRQYYEDRALTAWFLLDLSPSMNFGSFSTLKRGVLLDFVAVMARLLTRHGNRVGAVLHDGHGRRVIPAGGGRMQVLRLINKRKMPEDEAVQRISVQSPQADKLKAAAVVIQNAGSFEETWVQVQAAFSKISQPAAAPAPARPAAAPPGEKQVKVRRGNPRDANAIAALIKQVTQGQKDLTRADIMEAFGDKAYMLAEYGEELSGLVGWKVENLVARVDEFYIAASAPLEKLSPPLLEAVEKAAQELQSEAALVFVPLPIAQSAAQALSGSGYFPQLPEKLGVSAWKDAAKESMPLGTALLFKKLREDRVMKPI